MKEDLIVFTTLNDEDLAQEFVLELLDRELIKSGTIFPGVTTIFRWEKVTHIDNEYKIMLKTHSESYDRIEEYIMEKHPYLAPEIIRIPFQAGSAHFEKHLQARGEKERQNNSIMS